MFFADFLDAHFAHNLQFRGPFGVQIVMLFRVPGTLGNRLRTLKGIRFSHFGAPFWRDEFKARSGRCFFMDFYDFGYLLASSRGLFWDQNVKKWDTEKGSKKSAKKSMQELRVIPSNSGIGPMWSLKRT